MADALRSNIHRAASASVERLHRKLGLVGDGKIRVHGFEINPTTMAHVTMAWGAEILADQRPGRVLVPFHGDAVHSVITSQADLGSSVVALTGPQSERR